ncbi:MAG: hypothetical protein KDD82_27650 [Planctomycetes bacterium]|nr:hypothetical protein [Planctomycetota bacterium]
MTRTRSLALLLLLACATPAAAEDGVALIGSYTLAGVDSLGPYAGVARIDSARDGLRITLQRGERAPRRGRLVPGEGEGWRLLLDDGSAPPEVFRWADGVLDSGQAQLTRRGALRVAVSVDWEGRELADGNLRAMEAFERETPGVPLTHFLNAAYLTKPGADPAAVAAALRRVVRAGDERGLHVHGWHSLVTAAGVAFRAGPTFWDGGQIARPRPGRDAGHEVEIAAYTAPELRRIVAHSRRLLAEAGYELGGAFRAGGWIATPHVLEAVRAEGLWIDSSATTHEWHDELLGYALWERIAEVWPEVHATTQPYWIETPAGRVLEMPDTGALADYVTAEEMLAHLEQALEAQAAAPRRDRFVHLGFHQETAARYAPRVSAAIRVLRARHPTAPLVFEPLSASALGARAQLD